MVTGVQSSAVKKVFFGTALAGGFPEPIPAFIAAPADVLPLVSGHPPNAR